MIDYYRLLEVSTDTAQEDIQSAYRRLAKECHPDLHPDDKRAERRFIELTEAYNVLSDPEARKAYDESRLQPFTQAPAPQQPEAYRDAFRQESKFSTPKDTREFDRWILQILSSPLAFCLFAVLLMLISLKELVNTLNAMFHK